MAAKASSRGLPGKPIHRLPGSRVPPGTQSQFRPILAVSSIGMRQLFLGTSVADGVSYFSRFTVKFTEILAVGMATAVSGYLIAHVSGFLSSPAPSPILPAPNAGEATVNHPAPPSAGAVTVNIRHARASPSSRPLPASPRHRPRRFPPTPPNRTRHRRRKSRHPPSRPHGQPSTRRPRANAARTIRVRRRASRANLPSLATPLKPGRESPPRSRAIRLKPNRTRPPRSRATPRKPSRTNPPRSRATPPRASRPARKPRDWESVEARVRAALANAAANRPPTSEPPPPQTDVPSLRRRSPCSRRPTGSRAFRVTSAVSAPRAAILEPPLAAAAPEAPLQARPAPRSRDKITAGCRR